MKRVVMVTGAQGALGQVVCSGFSRAGYRVAAIDHANPPEPSADGDRIDLGGVDLTDGEQARLAVTKAVEAFGSVDVLANIAGGFAWQTIDQDDAATWERMHQLNLLTALNAVQAALPHLTASPSGRINNIGANAAARAAAGMGPYAASKAGVHRLTEALAEELKGRGVTVNAILPSIIDTAANRRDMPDASFAAWVSPAEAAAVILFLASPEASGVTGALIPVVGRV